MEDEKIIEFMAEYKNKMKVSEARVADLEAQIKQIQDLVISVHDLANSVRQMVEEQKEHGERLQSLEDAPKESWNQIKKTAIASIVSAVAGALAMGVIQMIALNL